MSFMRSLRMGMAIAAACCVASEAKVVHVSASGSDANDGTSWASAKQTVQDGLNAATSGDQVWVAAGTYVECMVLTEDVALYSGFAGTETDLSQRDWHANETVLDGNQAGSVVTSPSGTASATRIDGFTIRNGSGTPFVGQYKGGGGIYCQSSVTIINNTITANHTGEGGGIYCSYSSPSISNNTITGNTADGGGGIYCSFSTPTITHNTITANGAPDGGGIECYYSSSLIMNNTIADNRAIYGGGIMCSYCSPVISNNIITRNSTIYDGAIYSITSSPMIANNTIVSNFGTAFVCVDSTSTIVNTIIAFNSSGVFNCDTDDSTNTTTLHNCCVYRNTDYNYSGLSDPTGLNGNISAYPLFVTRPDAGPDGELATADDIAGDLHLAAGSPCIDAGDDSAVQAGWTDIDDQARVQGSHVDIGADEADPEHEQSPTNGDSDTSTTEPTVSFCGAGLAGPMFLSLLCLGLMLGRRRP